jgi:hypothetical protein
VIKRNTRPSASKLTVLRQLCNLIPPHLVPKLARKTGVDSMARSFSAWSHVVSMLFAQLTHAIGLNDVCDALRLHSGPPSALRGATPPSRNNLSHANKRRDAALAEGLFWAVLDHLQKLSMCLASRRFFGYNWRIALWRRAILLPPGITPRLRCRSC